MKKYISVIVMVVLIFTAIPATAGGVRVTLDGMYMTFDAPPQIANNRVMVPMRAIFEALGAEVFWDEDTQTVIAHIINDEIIVMLTIGSYTMLVDGFGFEIDAPPMIVDNRTLVPIRIVSELLGARVDWNEETSTVIIRTSF